MSKEAMKLRTAAEKVVEICSERPLSLGKWFIDMSEACESLREALAEQPAPVQQEPVAIPDNVRKIAKAMQKDGYRGPLSWARTVIDFVATYKPPQPPAQQTCNCRWEGEIQVQECTLHQSHLLAIHEWAGRAKAAEAKLEEQPAQQEPVAFVPREAIRTLSGGANHVFATLALNDDNGKAVAVFLSPQPAQRTWVGLMDEEMLAVVHYSQLDNARAIEAKLKEKNT